VHMSAKLAKFGPPSATPGPYNATITPLSILQALDWGWSAKLIPSEPEYTQLRTLMVQVNDIWNSGLLSRQQQAQAKRLINEFIATLRTVGRHASPVQRVFLSKGSTKGTQGLLLYNAKQLLNDPVLNPPPGGGGAAPPGKSTVVGPDLLFEGAVSGLPNSSFSYPSSGLAPPYVKPIPLSEQPLQTTASLDRLFSSVRLEEPATMWPSFRHKGPVGDVSGADDPLFERHEAVVDTIG
jgi:hypothetical protein